MNSYAANLAAAFTNHLLESNIDSVGGLLEAPDIRFGSFNGAVFSVLQVYITLCLFILSSEQSTTICRLQQALSSEKLWLKLMTMDTEPPPPMMH